MEAVHTGPYVNKSLEPTWTAAEEHVVELSGSVEYKSMPSGLHNVQEDLV